LARHSDLFVFSDAARNDNAAAAVRDVRAYVRTIGGFRSLTVVERDSNFGLSRSVIAGVAQLCNDYGCAIAVEDDIATAADFLTFMNRALQQYKDELAVFSISGFNFGVRPPKSHPFDAFFSFRSSSWGWGTWKDRWEKADWSVSDYSKFRADPARRKLFDQGGEDLSSMLDLQMAGKIDSWAIRWAYAHSKHGAFALLPTASKVVNTGLDGSGVHCRFDSTQQISLDGDSDGEYRFPDILTPDSYLAAEVRRLCSPSLGRKVARYVQGKFRAGRPLR
jgi:hypothetical protein